MLGSTTIRKCFAALLLLVFCIAATPKDVVHAVLADHQDYASGCVHRLHSDACLSKAGVNCHFHQLVVEHPYRGTAPLIIAVATNFHSSVPAVALQQRYSSREHVVDGRAPPSC